MRPSKTKKYKLHTLDVIVINEIPYLFAQQILIALGVGGYHVSVNDKKIKKLVTECARRNPDLTAVVEVETVVGLFLTRIFTPEGAAVLAEEIASPESADFALWARGFV